MTALQVNLSLLYLAEELHIFGTQCRLFLTAREVSCHQGRTGSVLCGKHSISICTVIYEKYAERSKIVTALLVKFIGVQWQSDIAQQKLSHIFPTYY